MNFSNSEMTDMVLMYGQALGNSLAFPERRLPNHKTFANVVQRLRENGKFQPRFSDRGRERTERTLDAEEEILNVVENDPGISIRRLSYRVGVSFECVRLLFMGSHERVGLPNTSKFC
ncbi:hypothetical protein Zmor_013510 [Zophobas morio]|uniref:DUF4817 domain-containing protein n=1 Tax=Zophobas morio TaxID=2755281 RepID=A0AA38IDL4_9CUCU|nr:hypothetical protein Zmor_013510 [Zophobas morio]